MGAKAPRTSCGVIVTDGERILLGHATRSPRWDIPKGEAHPGENFAEAAARELLEETGVALDPAEPPRSGFSRICPGRTLLTGANQAFHTAQVK